MKKKILTLALIVALVAIMVGGSLAYFTADDEVKNTFTIGSVKIQIEEDFDSPNSMIPVVTPDATDPNYVNKDAHTKNTGANDAYVQMYVAIPQKLDDAKAFIVVDDNTGDWTARAFAGNAEFGGVAYNVYLYRYTKVLPAGADTTDVITAAYLAPELDYRDGKFIMNGTPIDGYTPGTAIDIYVGAQAIQAEGFADYNSALNTFTTHPWA